MDGKVYQPSLEEVECDVKLMKKGFHPIRCSVCNKRLICFPNEDKEALFCECRTDPEWYDYEIKNLKIRDIRRLFRVYLPFLRDEVFHQLLLDIIGEDYSRKKKEEKK